MSVDLDYATALLRREDGDPDINPVVALRSPARSANVAGAAICQVEGARWMIMMAGYVDHRPGRTADDLVRMRRTEFPPEFGEVAGKEILGDVRSYRHAENLRRDFHALTRMPARLARQAGEFFALQRAIPVHGYRLPQWISNQIFTASVLDPEFGPRLEEVAHMLKHPSSLATPGTLIRSIMVNLQRHIVRAQR